MRSNRLLLFAASIVGFVLAGCGETEAGVEAFRQSAGDAGILYFQVEGEGPLSQGENDLLISIHEVSTHAVFSGATVELSAFMPAMAHDAPAVTIEERDGGRYMARGVSLPMAGRWQVEIKALRETTTDAVTFTYDLR